MARSAVTSNSAVIVSTTEASDRGSWTSAQMRAPTGSSP